MHENEIRENRIEEKSITIYEAMQDIMSGKYVIPAFQRSYVWSLPQIEKLWDSILLGYPIATFLYWHLDDNNVDDETTFCQFISDVTFNSSKVADGIKYKLTNIKTSISDIGVLDGQQRLTSLFISLYGDVYMRPKNARKRTGPKDQMKLLIDLNKYERPEDVGGYNEKSYNIFFTKNGRINPTHFELKRIISDDFRDDVKRPTAIEEAIKYVPNDSKEYARELLLKLYRKICEEKLIRYTEIYNMNQDDALEIFIRFNSGGKALKKSEITLSILEVHWPSARENFNQVLNGVYEDFGTDFIIRTSLMLYGKDVTKFIVTREMVEKLKNEWKKFKDALDNLEKMFGYMHIDLRRFSSYWNVLVPVIYYIYLNPNDYMKCAKGVEVYITRAIFFIYFRSGTPGKLKEMKSKINEYNYEINIDMLNTIRDLSVTEGKIDDLMNSAKKGTRLADEVLYYTSRFWIKPGVKYEEDHLHPSNEFEGMPYGISTEKMKHWRSLKDDLPNLHLLEGRSNASKSDMRLIDYYNSMNSEQQKVFYEQALIPENVSLELENFEEFYNARRLILEKKIRELIC